MGNDHSTSKREFDIISKFTEFLYIYTRMVLSNVLDLAWTAFGQKCQKKKKKEFTAKCKTFTVCEVLNFEPGNILTHKKCLTWLTDSIFTVASEINEWLSESIPVHIIHACIKQGDTVPIIIRVYVPVISRL